MTLTPLVELGVQDAYRLLTERFGVRDLPPLEAVEYEDWGRDLVLGRLLEIPAEALAEAGLTRRDRGAEGACTGLPGQCQDSDDVSRSGH